MPTIITRGALSAQGYGTFAPSGATYIEDVFSTYLYTGNGSTQTITNGIDLAGKGGLTLIKMRNIDATYGNYPFSWIDTVRGATNVLYSNVTDAQNTAPTSLTAFTSSGFSLGSQFPQNGSSDIFGSWTFRKQPKFFDIVTYTGNGANRTIAHNLGSVPGCIIVKRTDTTGDWQVYHAVITNGNSIQLNSTAAQSSAPTVWNSTRPTSSVFSVGTDASVNASGGTYVAYIFASNAGGFGASGTDNVITCYGYTGLGTALNQDVSVPLGYEPQWLLIKRVEVGTGFGSWYLIDTMRGMSMTDASTLYANNDASEGSFGAQSVYPTATGFGIAQTAGGGVNAAGANYIFIAIRRGPMKTPTDGTKVFAPVAQNGGGTITTNFPVDLALFRNLSSGVTSTLDIDRLRGQTQYMYTNLTNAEANGGGLVSFDNNTGYTDNGGISRGIPSIYLNFRRAPSFFDEVCYTSTNTTSISLNHNLGIIPEMIIVKNRSGTTGISDWAVYLSSLGTGKQFYLNSSAAVVNDPRADKLFPTTPTSTVFYVGYDLNTTTSSTYVAYLFATCPGVSKCGSYTGTGATQTINCGFTGGARFVLIKRTDSTGDWYVWDTARGMVSGTDPYLLLNSNAAEVNTNSVYTTGVGFQIVSTAAGINASSGSYIFFAVS